MSKDDVLVLGLGPVGATLALLLAAHGVRVRVLEREAARYPLPRALHFDDEVMRVFQSLGLADAILPATRISPGMKFVAPDGRLLMDWSRPQALGPLGWHVSYRFHQPALEDALREALAARGIAVETGVNVTEIAQDAEGVTAAGRRARWLVGCDGARSITRDTIGGGFEDLGFAERWLVVDLLLARPRDDLGDHSIQFCDPRRPATYVRGVGERRRFEITLHDDEAPDDRMDPALAWSLLDRWVTPADGTLERAAVYTFNSKVARRWRDRRVFIAGDAAHLTPPFLGQGLCAGIRDAANLAWKLARGDDPLLDTYQRERAPHVRQYIETAVRIGGLINTRAMAEALGTDAPEEPVRMASIAPALGGFEAPLGRPVPQPWLADGIRLDDRVGHRWAVLLRDAELPADRLAEQGAVLVADPALHAFLDTHNAIAALVRPDRQLCALARDATAMAGFSALMEGQR